MTVLCGHPRALGTIDTERRGAHYRRSRLDAGRLAVPEVPLGVAERRRLPRAARRAGCDVHRSSRAWSGCSYRHRSALARALGLTLLPSDAAPLARRYSTRLRRWLVSLPPPLPSRGGGF